MKLSSYQKAGLAVFVVALALLSAWLKYYDFLSQGKIPPDSVAILRRLETEGFPEFTLKTLDGREVQLKTFAGKAVLLNFWASWCDPCVAEFPSLLKLVSHFKGRVVLLAVSADYEKQDILAFLKVFPVSSRDVYISWDEKLGLAKSLGTFRLPESYVIGPNGKLVRKISGVDDWSTPEAFQFFEHILGAGK